MMALCAVWISHSRPRKMLEGGPQRAIPGFRGAIFEGHTEKVLRTFSGPVLNDDFIEPPFVGYMLAWMLIATRSLHKSQPRISWKQASYEVIERKLDLRPRELGQARTPPSPREPLVQVCSSYTGGPVCVLIVQLERLDPCRWVEINRIIVVVEVFNVSCNASETRAFIFLNAYSTCLKEYQQSNIFRLSIVQAPALKYLCGCGLQRRTWLVTSFSWCILLFLSWCSENHTG